MPYQGWRTPRTLGIVQEISRFQLIWVRLDLLTSPPQASFSLGGSTPARTDTTGYGLYSGLQHPGFSALEVTLPGKERYERQLEIKKPDGDYLSFSLEVTLRNSSASPQH